jgi:hypothetical protein
VTGAVNGLAPHPTNPDILYLGAVNGGLWRTTNATAAEPVWTPLIDAQGALNIGRDALQFDPTDATGNTWSPAAGAPAASGATAARGSACCAPPTAAPPGPC